MRSLLVIILSILLLSAVAFLKVDSYKSRDSYVLASSTPPPEEDEPIRIETELVNVLFTAQDSNRRFVTNLTKDDIKIFENGEEQEIFTFTRQTDSPLSIAILIDTSLSQLRTLPDEREAAKVFIESVVRPEKDEVAVLSFTGETTLEQDLTSNISRLRRAIDRIRIVPPSGTVNGVVIGGTPPISGRNQRLAGSTALWDAVWITADEVLRRSPERTRRTIILLTDGYDTSSRKKIDDAIKMALLYEITIYSIGIGDYFYGGVKESHLKKLSESTGGRAFFPKNESQLRNAFAEIEKEIRSQYLVAYQPKNQKKDGSFRRIEIRLVNPELVKQRIKLSHREGYFAKQN